MMAITLLAAATVFAAEPVGTIVSLTGNATATARDGTARNLELKSPVFLNDKIKTEANASLQMMFLDESVLSQGEKSEMTIDEYVYNPGKKEDNACTLNLGKGIFRAVTARITALNPERFKVKTKLATIGIRGCEVAFTITERGENIYALSLPDGKSIVITLNKGVSADNSLQITGPGIMVRIEEGGEITQRPITPQEAIDLIQEITIPPGLTGDTTGGLTLYSFIDQLNQQILLGTLDEEETEFVNALIELLTPPPTPEEEPVPETPATPAPALAFVQKGGGIDWKWGVWEIAGQTPQSVDFIGKSVLSATDVQTLYGGSPQFLSGIGDSAAIIKHDGSSYFVQGSCNVSVEIGSGSLNNWEIDTLGIPATDGLGTSLGYRITGTITAAGVLQPSGIGSTDYLLTVGGVNFGGIEINTQTVNANLTGAGAANPPTGIIGHFHITHDGGATIVHGGFGSDFGAF